jgi:hypothetical protein
MEMCEFEIETIIKFFKSKINIFMRKNKGKEKINRFEKLDY